MPRDLIDAAMAVAAQAPSACNRQPFEFRVFDSADRVREVASAPGGAAGFLENFPAIVAVIGRLDAFFSDRDRHLIYIDGSLAAMAFMLALETLGLASCAINTPGTEAAEEQLVKVLGLARYERPVMLIALGYPDRTGMVPRSAEEAAQPLPHVRAVNIEISGVGFRNMGAELMLVAACQQLRDWPVEGVAVGFLTGTQGQRAGVGCSGVVRLDASRLRWARPFVDLAMAAVPASCWSGEASASLRAWMRCWIRRAMRSGTSSVQGSGAR